MADEKDMTPEQQRRQANEEAASKLRAAAAVQRRGLLARPHLLAIGGAMAGLVVILVVAVILMTQSGPVAPLTPASPAPVGIAQSEPAGPPVPTMPVAVMPREDAQVAVTWPDAESAFAAKRYSQAAPLYRELVRISTRRDEAIIRDLLNLRLGECELRGDHPEQGLALLEALAASPSPIIRAWAAYLRANHDLESGQYLQARLKAYSAIVALMAMDSRLKLETDCDVIVAQALSRQVLGFYESGAILWQPVRAQDPFAGLDHAGLLALLQEGYNRPQAAVVGPEIRKQQSPSYAPVFSVSSRNYTIDDLLSRFATAAAVELRWMSVPAAARRRVQAIDCRETSEQRFGEVLCGSVGLLSRFSGDEITVLDPQACNSLSEQREVLLKEAISVWRRLFIRNPEDRSVPQGYFAVALLQECSGAAIDAMKEYQMLAARFEHNAVAPQALLRAAQIRINMRDFTGARANLLDILDRYPDCPASADIYLSLGRTTMEAGLLTEAAGTFRKLYHLNLTGPSQKLAALELGRCFHRSQEYAEASKWLTRFIGLADKDDAHLAEAFMMLARSEAQQDHLDEAVAAYQRALLSRPSEKDRPGMLLELAAVQARQQRYPQALAVLGRLHAEELTEGQVFEAMALSSRVYRAMALPDRSIRVIREKLSLLSSSELLARAGLELAGSYREVDDTDSAIKLLEEALPKLRENTDIWNATVMLAELNVKIGKPMVAITMIQELLKGRCPETVRTQAAQVLGNAYLAQKDYDKAALAFSGVLVKPVEGQPQ